MGAAWGSTRHIALGIGFRAVEPSENLVKVNGCRTHWTPRGHSIVLQSASLLRAPGRARLCVLPAPGCRGIRADVPRALAPDKPTRRPIMFFTVFRCRRDTGQTYPLVPMRL